MAKADLAKARALYPSCGMGVEEWAEFFGSPAGLRAMGRIFYDIYDELKTQEEKAEGVRRIGRRRGRPAVSLDEVFQIVMPHEFQNDPFPAALKIVIGSRSQRQFARRVPISQPHLSRLLSGQVFPDLSLLERLADAGGVKPWFFAEWRALYIGQLITEVLHESPHLSIAAMRDVRERRQHHEGVRRAR